MRLGKGKGLWRPRCASPGSWRPASRPRRRRPARPARHGDAERRAGAAPGDNGRPGYLVYWDQNEEVDFLYMPGAQGQLLPAWDLNGQVCVLPAGASSAATTRRCPASATSAASSPTSSRPTGRSSNCPTARSAVRPSPCPGPYKMPGQTVGQDSPPTADGSSTTTRPTPAAPSTSTQNIFGADIATAQGDYPPPSSGRLVEWFARAYRTSCIVYGPTVGWRRPAPHRRQRRAGPAGRHGLAPNGDLLVPNVGTQSVLRFARSSLPTSVAQCPGGAYPRVEGQLSKFVRGVSFPAGVARDPACGCYAVSSFIGTPPSRG